jgi:hypothetical protein
VTSQICGKVIYVVNEFKIVYKKGSEMPADYLSRNFVNAISWSSEQQQQAQSADPLLKALKFFAKQRAASQCQKSCTHKKLFSTDGFIENRIIWCCNQKVV